LGGSLHGDPDCTRSPHRRVLGHALRFPLARAVGRVPVLVLWASPAVLASECPQDSASLARVDAAFPSPDSVPRTVLLHPSPFSRLRPPSNSSDSWMRLSSGSPALEEEDPWNP
jgi:hypothetical protein